MEQVSNLSVSCGLEVERLNPTATSPNRLGPRALGFGERFSLVHADRVGLQRERRLVLDVATLVGMFLLDLGKTFWWAPTGGARSATSVTARGLACGKS